jgi:hypothetical protein
MAEKTALQPLSFFISTSNYHHKNGHYSKQPGLRLHGKTEERSWPLPSSALTMRRTRLRLHLRLSCDCCRLGRHCCIPVRLLSLHALHIPKKLTHHTFRSLRSAKAALPTTTPVLSATRDSDPSVPGRTRAFYRMGRLVQYRRPGGSQSGA